MKLGKAIEVLEQELNEPSTANYPNTKQATLLGIEALKRLAKARQQYSGWSARPLPGETED